VIGYLYGVKIMGVFSWLTSDTKESIQWGVKRTVYLLQPNGQPPIADPCYDGYGRFGGRDAFLWLFEQNEHLIKGDTSELTDEEKRTIAIYMDGGDLCQDPETGQIYHVDADLSCIVPGKVIRYYFDEVPGFGKTVRELLDSGRFTQVPVSRFFQIKYPLKFSFDPEANYERLPAAEVCPWQGMPPAGSEDY
jgi:hypothetical protein